MMSFRKLLYTLSGSLLVLVAVSTSFLAYMSWETQGFLAEQRASRAELDTLRDFGVHVAEMKSSAFALAITRRAAQQEAMDDARSKAMAAAEAIRKGEHRQVAERLTSLIGRFHQVMGQVQEGLREENRNPAVAQFRNEVEPLVEELSRETAALAQALTSKAVAAQAQVEQNNQKVMSSALGMLALALVLGLSLSVILVRAITAPVKSLRNTIESVAHQSNLALRCEVTTQDEIGEIGQSLNQMLGKFQNIIARASTSTAQVAASATEMSAVAAEARKSLERHRGETNSVSVAVTELATTAQEVANSVSRAAQAAEHAHKEAGRGRVVVNETLASVAAMAREMEGAVTTMDKLSEDSQRIRVVMQTIESIAEQTNLLALNASIESARAGEHGRGFAIVATEVRGLATKVQQSIREIRQIVEGLQSSSGMAVQVMQRGRHMVQDTMGQATRTSQALVAINDAVETIRSMNTHIADSAEEQTRVTEEINGMVVNIHEVSEQNARGAEQIATASEELATLSGELQALVVQFRA